VLFNFALEYAITKIQKNLLGLKWNGTYERLAYADNMNLLGDDLRIKSTVKENKETFSDASKEINIKKAKCMLLSPHQNASQNRDIKIANRSFENVALEWISLSWILDR
jgi:hypothetical protein